MTLINRRGAAATILAILSYPNLAHAISSVIQEDPPSFYGGKTTIILIGLWIFIAVFTWAALDWNIPRWFGLALLVACFGLPIAIIVRTMV